MEQAQYQSKEKDIECNLRLKISTEREETMASGKEFQVLIIRFEKKFPSRTDTVCKSVNM